jgi:CBS domain-containing protein
LVRVHPHELVGEELDTDLRVVGGPRRYLRGRPGLVARSTMRRARYCSCPDDAPTMSWRRPSRPSRRSSTVTTRQATPPEAVDDDPPITTIMTADPVRVASTARLPTALHLMASTGVRHLPVMHGERCLGLVVEADLIRRLAQVPGPSAVAAPANLGELVHPGEAVPPTARVSEAARRMHSAGSDVVLVVDGAVLLGIVTATDLIRFLAGTAGPRPR